MRALHRKLIRDLGTMKGQVAAIAVVIGAGVMTLILFLTTYDALTLSKERFYEQARFADVFANLKRAPDSVVERLQEIPGVSQAETRVRAAARLEVAGFADPVRGDLISIPEGRQPNINALHLREGRLPERADEVAVSEPFAQAHRLRPGDRVRAIIRGGFEELTIVGVALSPEFLYQVGPGDILPDYERYAVLWMNRRALSQAYGMDGAFNNVVLTLQAGASPQRAIEHLDQILRPYGGIGAHDRSDQISHRFISEEIAQIRVMATMLPTIFLGVAAFLLHVLMGRIIRTQREQIAVLKAFGYSNLEVGAHYAMLTGLIVLVGAVVGIALGAWAAGEIAVIYLEYYRFPELSFRLQPHVMLVATLVAGGAAALGTAGAVRGAMRLPPAEAMRPPPPERFRRGMVDAFALTRRLLGQPSRIILRNLARHPVKSVLSIVGIGLSGSLLLVGSYQFGAVDSLIDTQYRKVLKMDLDLTFTEPTSERAVAELRSLPGVLYVESYRATPVRLVNGLREYRTSILGTDAIPQLRGLIGADGRQVALPTEGILLTGFLADYLGVAPGDTLEAEILEGRRQTVVVTLAGTIDEPLGVSAYMERRALNRLLREGYAISGAWILREQDSERPLIERLWGMPRIAGIGMISQAEVNIREYMDDTVLVFMGVLLLLSGSIAFAVVYNNARIALAERARELATLRVLGFTHGEVAWILLGEIGLLTLVSIPFAWATGSLFAFLLSHAMAMDMFRIPLIITPGTYAFAAAGVLAAAVLSGMLMVRRLRQLDMVSALKAVE